VRSYSLRVLEIVKRICNYKFSRGRKSIECIVLNDSILIRFPQNVNFIIKATYILHNYLRKKYFSTLLLIPQVVNIIVTLMLVQSGELPKMYNNYYYYSNCFCHYNIQNIFKKGSHFVYISSLEMFVHAGKNN